jgi:hypothetical protein
MIIKDNIKTLKISYHSNNTLAKQILNEIEDYILDLFLNRPKNPHRNDVPSVDLFKWAKDLTNIYEELNSCDFIYKEDNYHNNSDNIVQKIKNLLCSIDKTLLKYKKDIAQVSIDYFGKILLSYLEINKSISYENIITKFNIKESKGLNSLLKHYVDMDYITSSKNINTGNEFILTDFGLDLALSFKLKGKYEYIFQKTIISLNENEEHSIYYVELIKEESSNVPQFFVYVDDFKDFRVGYLEILYNIKSNNYIYEQDKIDCDYERLSMLHNIDEEYLNEIKVTLTDYFG